MAFEFIQQKLQQQQSVSRFRARNCFAEHAGRELNFEGKTYLNFSSNDYLGLNHHPVINAAMQEGVDRFGSCASGSNLITGYQYAHQALEETICQWLNKPRCILYSSGFAANFGTLQALGLKNVTMLLDKLSHASLIDGAYGSDATVKRFAHNDIEHLAKLLNKQQQTREKLKQLGEKQESNTLIVSEGVFSMDGDCAPLSEINELAQQYNAWQYIDDAHSIGVIGDKGQGSIALNNDINIVMATFGKAIATSGAFVACEQNVYDYLVNFSRHYIYSTAISPAVAWATRASILLIQQEQWRRDKIFSLSELLVKELRQNIKIIPTDSSIHAIVIGDEEKTLDICQQLKKQGIWLTAIRPPTVAKGTSRLRVTLCASHKEQDIKYLARKINEVLS